MNEFVCLCVIALLVIKTFGYSCPRPCTGYPGLVHGKMWYKRNLLRGQWMRFCPLLSMSFLKYAVSCPGGSERIEPLTFDLSFDLPIDLLNTRSRASVYQYFKHKEK